MRIWSIDPGTKNFAWCLIKPPDKILKMGSMIKTIQDMQKGMIQFSLTLFVDEASKLIKSLKLEEKDLILVERWMPRRGARGNVAESVNLMVGSLFTLCDCNFELVAASTWKNYFNRHYKTKDQQIIDLIKNSHISEHHADAIGIAAHYIETKMKKKEAWKKLKKEAKKWSLENFTAK